MPVPPVTTPESNWTTPLLLVGISTRWSVVSSVPPASRKVAVPVASTWPGVSSENVAKQNSNEPIGAPFGASAGSSARKSRQSAVRPRKSGEAVARNAIAPGPAKVALAEASNASAAAAVASFALDLTLIGFSSVVVFVAGQDDRRGEVVFECERQEIAEAVEDDRSGGAGVA